MPANLDTFEKIIIPQSNIISQEGTGERYEWEPIGRYYSEARELAAMAVSKDPTTGEKFLYMNGGMYVQGYSWDNTYTYNTNSSSNTGFNVRYSLDKNTFINYSSVACTRRLGGAGGYWDGYFYYLGGVYAGNGSTNLYVPYFYMCTDPRRCSQNSGEAAITPNPIPSYFYQPAYCQKDNLLYIFGGSPFTGNMTSNTSGQYTLVDAIMNIMNADNRKSYVFDMSSQTMTQLPNLPITGGRFLSACISGDYIYIRNLEAFCRFNMLTKSYETLPSFQRITDTNIKPEIINFNDNNVDIIISTSGYLDAEYAECYNITTNKISKWSYPAFPTQRFKLFNIDNELYQVCGSINTKYYHGFSVCKMVKKESTIKAERPIVAKIPSGSYYHGIETLNIPELGITIKTTQQKATKDYYITKGMYSYPSEYALYLESK